MRLPKLGHLFDRTPTKEIRQEPPYRVAPNGRIWTPEMDRALVQFSSEQTARLLDTEYCAIVQEAIDLFGEENRPNIICWEPIECIKQIASWKAIEQINEKFGKNFVNNKEKSNV